MARGLYFTLTSDGDGTINDIIVKGTIANQNDGAATQTLNGVTYSVSGGLGTLNGDSGEAERSFRREAERHSGMIPNTIGA